MPTPLTRTFRATLPGRTARSNLQSGIGLNGEFTPRTPLRPIGSGYGTGLGYGTGQSEQEPPAAPTAQATPAAAPVAARSTAQRPTTGLRRATPNAGGTITRGGKTTTYAPSAYNAAPDRPNLGGTMTRDIAPGVKATTIVPPSPSNSALKTPAASVAAPTTVAAPQSESNNPLTGDTNDEAEETTEAVDPGQALGLNQRGSTLPKGTDAMPKSGQGGVGGTGLYARQFANPKSAGLYDSYVRKIFGDNGT